MRPLALAVALLLTTAASADELYVPLASQTEVEIVNASPHLASVDLEVLGGTSTRVELEAGERLQWNEPQSDLAVLRIAGDAALQVTAVSRTASAVVILPVLAPSDAVDQAVAAPGAGAWRSGILVVNPNESSAVATVDGTVEVLGPRGVVHGATLRAATPLLVFAYAVNEATGVRVFTKVAPHARSIRRRAVRSVTPPPQVQTQTVVLTPSKDNTLYEAPNGETSNGAGVHVFAGTTQSRTRRRALLAFDVAAQVPPGSRITRVTLTLRVSQTISGPEPVALHRVAANWGEGTSNAGSSRDGGGASSAAGDATWVHTFSPNARWTTRGGDFDAAADATASVASTTGTWESAAMIARVQQWLDQPASNFGWILVGNESRASTAKRFDSREAQPATSRPSLTIEFER
jgi:hypothetical protein